MEKRKYEHRKIERHSKVFFLVGLNIALLLTIAAFEWKSNPSTPKISHEKLGSIFSDEDVLPPIAHKYPLPKKPTVIEYKEVEKDPIKDIIEDLIEEEHLDEPIENLEWTEDFKDYTIEEPDEAPFEIVEIMPSFPGGWQAFYDFVGKNAKYPAKAKGVGIEGKVFVEFIIEKDGSITDLKVIKGVGYGLDEEALRVMHLVPNFIPGRQGPYPARVKKILSIEFKLRK